MDCRGCYTAMATLRLLKMDPAAVVARAGMVDFIRRCQASFASVSCRRTLSFQVPGCSESITYLFEGADVVTSPGALIYAVPPMGLLPFCHRHMRAA